MKQTTNRKTAAAAAVADAIFNRAMADATGFGPKRREADADAVRASNEAFALLDVKVPALEINRVLKLDSAAPNLRARIRREQRITAGLIAWLGTQGWTVESIGGGDDGDDKVSTPKEAMELAFNLDEVSLRFQKGASNHTVLLVFGNDLDLISDWSYSKDDVDGFNAAMEALPEPCEMV